MKRVVALLCLGLVGCPSPAPLPEKKPEGCSTVQNQFEALGEVGVPLQVELGLTQACATEPINPWIADNAVVEVFDPDGELYPSTHETPVHGQLGHSTYTNSVKVTFTPNRLGRWRLTSRLEPAIGQTTHSVDVIPFEPALTSRTIDARNLPTECRQYNQSTFGTVLCSGGFRQEVVTQQGQVIPSNVAAINGSALWVWKQENRRVERWEEVDGGAYGRTHHTEAAGTFALMVAVPEGLWFYAAGLGFEPTAVRLMRPLPDGGLDGPRRSVGYFAGTTLTAGPGVAHLAGDSALFTVSGLDDAGSSQPLPQLTRGPAGLDDSTLWSVSADELEVLVVTDAGLIRATTARPNSVKTLTIGYALSPGLPLWTSTRLTGTGAALGETAETAEIADGGIVFVGHRVLDAGFHFVSATKQHLYARSDDGRWLQVIDR